jgi:hypothetical protein
MNLAKHMFLVTAATVVLGAVASPALAGSRRYPVTVCTMESDYIGDYVFNQGIANQSPNLGGRFRTLHCPIFDSDAEKGTISGIGVNGYDGNHETTDGNLSVRTCASTWWGGGLSCTAYRDVTNGSFTPSPTYTGAVSEWLPAALVSKVQGTASTGDYAEMQVKIPRVDLSRSEFYGYTTLF